MLLTAFIIFDLIMLYVDQLHYHLSFTNNKKSLTIFNFNTYWYAIFTIYYAPLRHIYFNQYFNV